MPTTPGGIVYPDSSAHTRLWEHLEALAESVDAAAGGELDKLPRGYLAEKKNGVQVSNIGSTFVSLNLAQALTLPAGRRIKLTAEVPFVSLGANAEPNVNIRMDGASIQVGIGMIGPTNAHATVVTFGIVSPSAGSRTFEVFAKSGAGGNVATYVNGSDQFAHLLIEDVGGV